MLSFDFIKKYFTELVFPANDFKTGELNLASFINILQNFLSQHTQKEVIINENRIEFTPSNPLFFYPYKAQAELELNEDLKISISIRFIETFKVLIILIIFVAFFSHYNTHDFLVTSISFSLFFILFNSWLLVQHTKQLILKAFNLLIDKQQTELSRQQKEWLQNPDKCPACGYDISIYDKDCPDCGLKLRNKVPTKPFDISGNYTSIKYHFKSNK